MSLGYDDQDSPYASGLLKDTYGAPQAPCFGTILLVEDEEMVRAFAPMALEEEGYRVFQAGDANEAAYIWSRESGAFDLLLTDISLPGESGVDLAKELRSYNPDLQVIFASGYSDGGEYGIPSPDAQTGFLPKPYSVKNLLGSVRRALPVSAASRL